MITKKEWDEFRDIGLLLFINQILHILGWAIVFDYDENSDKPNVYPARVKFRGFDNNCVSKCYENLSRYMKDNASQLYEEACS